MKFRLLILCTVLLLVFSQIVEAQKVLLLQKPGKTSRFLYEKGDKIAIRIGDPEFMAAGEITYIDDSLCTINKDYTFQIAKVSEVIRPRTWFLYSWKKLYLASAIYATGSMINHGINNEVPVFDNTIPWVSGSFIVLGSTAYLLRYRHCKMEDQWRLKVLDFDIYNQ